MDSSAIHATNDLGSRKEILTPTMSAPSRLFRPCGIALLLAVAAWLFACDSPQYPLLCGSIPEQTIVVGETVTVDACFEDPDGDMLAFEAFTSDPGVATVVAAASAMTVTAVSPGVALVTMVATDPTGLKAQQSFRVVVPNRPPAAVGTIGDRELMVGDSAVVEVAGYFSEPDGQALAYSAASSDSSRVAVSVVGSVVTLAAVAKGTVEVTVTATDPGGLAATQSFRVKVPNRPPVPVDSIPGREIMVDRADTLDMTPFFSDPDGDPLTYLAAVSDSAVAGASVAGSALTVAGLAKGAATVTITATDDEGLFATQRFQVTVPNRPPMATDTIPPGTLFKGEADTLELASYFSDADGDPLVWGAETADSTVLALGVSAAAGTLVVTARSQGETTVTVTATDTEGLSAQQSFAVTVPNRSPATADTIPPQTLYKRETVQLDPAHHFRDPDGDVLSYVIDSSDSLVATGTVTDGALTVRAGVRGQATLAVTATDPGGLSARQDFAVTVLNRAPVITDSIPPQTIFRGPPHMLGLDAHFGDPDGDTLSYSAVSSNRRFVRVEVAGGSVAMRAVRKGAAEVTVTAADPDGATAEQTFAVTVGNRAPVPVGTFPDLELGRGDRLTLPVDRYFSDRDRDALTYGASTSDAGVATATMRRTLVTLAGVSDGLATLTLTATDPEGLAATQTSRIIVAGLGVTPRPVGEIPGQTIAEGSTRVLALSGYFEDPNGDPLAYGAVTEDPDVATASVSGAGLTILGVSTGQTILTVTATDPAGNSGTLSTEVTVVPLGQAPVAVAPVPDQSVEAGRVRVLSVAGHFQDPDGGSLDFAASSSDPDVATAAASGSDVTLTGVAEGRTTATVTATDSDGLTAAQSFSVTVEPTGRGPVTVGAIAGLLIEAGGVDVVDAASYFRDPEGDSLGYGAGTSDPGIATASASGSIVTVRGVATGTTTLTVTATDPSGLSASQSAEVEVTGPPPGPEAVGTVPNDSIMYGDTIEIDMAPYFTHPGGLALRYTAGTSSTGVAAVDMTGATLKVTGQGRGTATITVIASDPNGRTATQQFSVMVTRIDTGFQIQLGFASGVGATLEAAMRSAAATWEAILKATEFPDIVLNRTFSCRIGGFGFDVELGYLDDLAIAVGAARGAPGGTLAVANRCVRRVAGGDPVLGIILFDDADVARMAQGGDLTEVAMHEIAHILGIGLGPGWHSSIVNPSDTLPGADTHFPGSRAVSAFNAAGGGGYAGGKVPVENGGDDGHWRESVMGSENMTPRNTLGEADPLSAVTLQALADLGYSVNAALAEAYALPSPDIAGEVAEEREVIDLRNDVYRGPVIEIDGEGNIMRVVPGLDVRLPQTPLRPGGAAAREAPVRIRIPGLPKPDR